LNLNHNKLTSEGASGIIKGLAQAPNEFLTDLHLENNQIDDAALQALAESLPNLPKLKVVHLQNNKIGDKGVKSFVDALANTPNSIPSLNLSHNHVTEAGALDIANCLKASKTITSVHLAHNEISDAGAEALASALLDNASVEDLDLSNNHIGNKGALAFQKVTQNNKTIQTINLSGNKNIVGGEQITPLLNQHGFVFPGLIFTRLN